MKHPAEDDIRAGGLDPTQCFRSLSENNPPEEFWVGFWPSVRAGIREAQMSPEGLLTRTRALLLGSSAGMMAAAAILVAAFLVIPQQRIHSNRGALGGVPGPASIPRNREVPSPPILEDLRSSSARVYTFRVGEPADSTEVILIVDESLDI